MRLFPWLKQKEIFSPEEKQRIVEAVRVAERMTSGEVRVFVESRCRWVDAIDRAAELFFRLKMDQTVDRNGVLIYVAVKDHQLAVFGDEGIHKKMGNEYWLLEVKKMIAAFDRQDYAEGIRQCVEDIGRALHQHFPFNNDTDKNELPDEIVFGN
ncbi:MAG TPA: TPM domain-containing protein [Chitinophagaceae bacterium]|nr:TPM domain-containing protein [Chitinophagaceae bacterium]